MVTSVLSSPTPSTHPPFDFASAPLTVPPDVFVREQESMLAQDRLEFKTNGCHDLLHPTTARGYLKKLQLKIARDGDEFFSSMVSVGWGVSGMFSSFVGIHALYGALFHNEDLASYQPDKSLFMTIAGVGLVGTASVVLAAVSAVVTRHTSLSDRIRFEKCQGLAGAIREGEARQRMANKIPADTPSEEMMALPSDVGIGATAAADASLCQGGTGAVDSLMFGLSMLIGAGTGPAIRTVISLPRAAIANWRTATAVAGTL